MKRVWAKGKVERVRGVHCVRLDSETHEIAKMLAENNKMSIKDFVQLCIKEKSFISS